MPRRTTNSGIAPALFDYLMASAEATPFYNLLELEIIELGPGFAKILAHISKKHGNPIGLLHGGLIMTAADAAMGNAVRSLGIRGATVDFNTSFLAAGSLQEDVIAEGKIIKAGSSLYFADALIYSQDRLIARSSGTFYKLGSLEY